MAVARSPDVLDHVIETGEPGRRPPIRVGERLGRVEGVRRRARLQVAEAVGLDVHVTHELAPPEDLPDEAFLAREREIEHQRVVDDLLREEPAVVHQRRHPRMEEPGGPRRHRIFVGPEVFEARVLRPGPRTIGVGPRRRQRGRVERARVISETVLDERGDLPLHVVHLEDGRDGGRRIALPRLPIVRVEAVLAALGLPAVHENARLLSHAAIEAIHPPGSSAGERRPELIARGEPGLVREDLDPTVLDERRQCRTELVFRGFHHPERTELLDHPREQRVVGIFAEDVPDGDAACRLLEGVVPLTRQDHRELLLVVGPLTGLPRRLDEDDADLARRGRRQGADPIGQLVVRHVDPLTNVRRICLIRGAQLFEVAQPLDKDAHDAPAVESDHASQATIAPRAVHASVRSQFVATSEAWASASKPVESCP
jgi:hypothetical protein